LFGSAHYTHCDQDNAEHEYQNDSKRLKFNRDTCIVNVDTFIENLAEEIDIYWRVGSYDERETDYRKQNKGNRECDDAT